MIMVYLKILKPDAKNFILNALAHVVGSGYYGMDPADPARWLVDLLKNNWRAHIKDGVLSINGRSADELTHQAVKTVLLHRCYGVLSEVGDKE